jgi:hypothetical protein
MKTFETAKGTVLPLLDLRGKDYLQVAHRIVWFREELPDWSIETQIVEMSEKHCVFRAAILNEDGRVIANGTKSETMAGFPDFIEKAETGAIGRALALCGFGTQFAPDLDEGERLADSPLPRAPQPNKIQQHIVNKPVPPPQQTHVTDLPDFGDTGSQEHELANYPFPNSAKKYIGKTLGQVPMAELKSYKEYMHKYLSQDGTKPIGKAWSELLNNIDIYLGAK